RPIIEGLGGALTWIPETRSVEVELGGVTIQLQIGNQTAIVNGQSVTMDVPAAIINSRTMLPVRFVSENIGADVDWEDLTRTVTIRVTVSSTLGGTALQPFGRSTGPAA
ncbi:MAG TPA: copper amine oxidase N-terminal domain-containing protein, partial [Candidatus Cryosericum sp.]